MKTKPHAIRMGNQIWSDAADSLRADSWSLSGHRGDVFAKTVTAAGPQAAQAPADGPQHLPGVLVINEIDSDTVGTDALEFVELYDGGLGNMSLNGYVLVFFNGNVAGDTSYRAMDLDGFSTDANGYFLIGNPGVAGVGLTFPNNTLQNGQDAVALYLGNATDFPNGTAPTTTNLVDAIVYDNSNADDPALLAALGETTQYDENGNALGTTQALARVPNETGGFVAQAPTPGAANTGETQTVVFNPTSVIHNEGNSGTTAYSFTVTRTGGTTGQLDFSGTIAAGTTDNADYVGGTAPTLFSGSILAGQTSATVTVNIQGDYTIEGNESFTLTLTSVTNAAAGVTEVIGANLTATGNITNDDSAGAISVADVSLAEGDAGTTVGSFTVTRAGGATGTVTVDYIITLPGGVGGADGADVNDPLSGQVTFLEGETTASISFNINGDVTFEPDETFTVTISNPQGGATLGDDTATATITNDDAAPAGTLSINDVSLAEGNSGPTAFTFTVTRSGGSAGVVGATWTLSAPGGAGNADAGDFAGAQLFTGTVSFADGDTSETITINVEGDTVVEANEAFTVTLSNATGGSAIGDGTGAGAIQNEDVAPPVISIGDAAVVEGDDGVTYLVFTVSLSAPSLATVTVDFDTSDATAAEDSDYLGLTGQVSFAPGDTSETISVPLIGDDAPENNETFVVTLSNPTGASIGDGSATGTITNDDGPGYYSLAGGSFTQAWTTTTQITADDNWSSVPYIIGYLGDIDAGSSTNVDPRTLTGAALGAIDVIANQSGTAITNGGVGEFEIANPTVGLQGSGTADAPSIVLYMDASGRSSVRLQANIRDIDATADDAAQQVNVQYRTSPGGAWTNVPGAYFADVTTASSATQVTALDVVLPAGADNAATLEIRIMTTNAAGSDEWVGIDDIIVSSAVSGPSLSIANAAVFEGDAGPTIITFTVTRAGTSTGAVTADYAVSFGSGPFAASADDFTALSPLSGQVVFADGQTTAEITLSVDGDVGPEGDEDFTITLSNPSAGATIADAVATGTIVNDDGPPPLVTINDVTVTEGDAGTSLMTFTVTRTGGTGAFDVDWETADGSATAGEDYVAASGTVHFADGQMTDTVTVAVTVNGDTDPELGETLQILLSNPTNFALITDPVGVGTIAGDDPIYIHDIQGTSYYSPILAGEGISGFNIASAGSVIVRAVVTAVDNDGPRQGYYLAEEITDWDGNSFTSEGIFVMTRNDASVGVVVSGVTVGDLVQVSAQVMEYQAFSTMPRTMLVNPTDLQILSTGNALPTLTLTNMPNAVLTGVTPDFTDSADGVGDTFDASVYALSYFETVEGMLVTIPNMVVADGFVSTSGGDPFFQAYSLDSANADQINSRGGYTIAGDPPIGPPDTAETGDDTNQGGRHLHDGDVNPDIIELDFTGWAMSPPPGLATTATMGDMLGDVTGIIDFDFTDRKLFVTAMEPGGFVNGGIPVVETTALGNDSRALTVATFNVENLDPGDGAARFTALANAMANNLNAPDIICIEEMQDNNGATASGGADASTTWQMLVDALNLATGANYQWVDQEPNGAEGGEPGGNIRVGFLYNTDRVQLGDLAPDATLAERRMYTDRIGDGVRDAGDLIAFSDDMLGAEILTADWSGTRRSLLGEFTFNGNVVYVTANHFPAKGGSGEFWQFDQDLEAGDPDNSGWSQRNRVGEDVYSMMNLIEAGDPAAGIVAGGDFNDFYFYRPLTTLTGHTLADGTARVGGARFDNLTLTLTEAERYTYTFDGRSQAIDHVIVNSLLSGVAGYDIVHINTGYNASGTGPDADPGLSDHDPALSSFDFRDFSEVLTGSGGNDVILGFGGNDRLIGGLGADALAGDAGVDTASYEDQQGSVYVDLRAGLGYGNAAQGDTYSGIENVIGTLFGDGLVGDTGVNRLDGGDGDDTLIGGLGADVLIGGAGSDTASYEDHYGSVYVDLLAGLGYGNAAQGDTYSGIENVTGSLFGDGLVGDAGDNWLDGGNGDDTLIGGLGADTLIGGDGIDTASYEDHYGAVFIDLVAGLGFGNAAAGDSYSGIENVTGTLFNDVLFGDANDNRLDGGVGDDVLMGGVGTDVLVGGHGSDTLLFGDGDSGVGGTADRIADFTSTQDKIDLSGIDASTLAGGDQAFAFVGTAAFTGAAGQLRYTFDGVDTRLQGDTDGDGLADFEILFTGSVTPIVSDFVL